MFVCSTVLVAVLLGCSGGDSKTEEPSESDIASACEEACLEADACDPTMALPDGYCATDCAESAQHSSDIGCANEYLDLVTCQAASNDCPLPACLEEARAYDDCVPDGQGDPCDQYCFLMSNTCMSATDNATCESDCASFQQLGVQAGCPMLIDQFLECRVANSACTFDDIMNACWDESLAYDACLN
jgi:hypothetical protein